MPEHQSVADEIARLYGLDPGDFVAARNAVVKAWRPERRDDASVIARLRKPSAAEHLVNRAARADREAAVSWRDARVHARRAQDAAIGGAGADELRAALAALRAAAATFVQVAVNVADGNAKRDEVLTMLQALPMVLADDVVSGVLGSATTVGDDPFAGAPDPPTRSRRAEPSGPSPAELRRQALVRERDKAAAAVEATTVALHDALGAQRVADARVADAQAALAAAESRVDELTRAPVTGAQ